MTSRASRAKDGLPGHRVRRGGGAFEVLQPQRIVPKQMIEVVNEPDIRPMIAHADQFDAVAATRAQAIPRRMNVPLNRALLEKSLQMMTPVTARNTMAGSGCSGVR